MENDMLTGAYEIARFVFGNESETARKRIYHLAESRELPIFKIGKLLQARKSTLRAVIEERERAVMKSSGVEAA
jgi:hypothetical protein